MDWLKNMGDSFVSLLPWIVAVIVIKVIATKKIHSRIEALNTIEEGENDENYGIKELRGIGILFLVATLFFTGLLMFAFIDGQSNVFIVLILSVFIITSGISTLYLFIWRVSVHGDLIEHRSFLGIKKIYNFKDITKGIYRKNGTLEVYVGDKKICIFDENVDATMFEYGMRKRNIPIEERMECEGEKYIIRPKKVYFIMPGLFFLAFIGCSIAVTFEAGKIIIDSLVMLMFACIAGTLFGEFISDKTIVQEGCLYRKKFLRKTYKIKLSEITSMERKRGLVKEYLILYRNGKKIAAIWTKNENINWLQAKILEEKKKKRKS